MLTTIYLRTLQTSRIALFSTKSKPVIKFSEAALKRISSSKQAHQTVFFNLDSGGCAGFKLDFTVDMKPSKHDVNISQGDVTMHTDQNTAKMLEGAIVDYTETLTRGSFTIKHPAIVQACGCKESFVYNLNYLEPKKNKP